MKFEFKHVEGRIILASTIQVWGEDMTTEIDVTDKVMPVVDDYLDHHLGLKDSKYSVENAKVKYTK